MTSIFNPTLHMTPPGTPWYLAPLHKIFPGHKPTVYVWSISISAEFTISEITLSASWTHLTQHHFTYAIVVISIDIFALLPIFYPNWLNVSNFVQYLRYDLTYRSWFNSAFHIQIKSYSSIQFNSYCTYFIFALSHSIQIPVESYPRESHIDQRRGPSQDFPYDIILLYVSKIMYLS